jgi:hypothetical protein
MKETKFTPGPLCVAIGETCTVREHDGGIVCMMDWLKGPYGMKGKRPEVEVVATAKLFAAAPDLYRALETVLSQYKLFVGPCYVIERAVVAQAESVLASARGELSPVHLTTEPKEMEG